jgi:hypothetical protein
MLTINNIKKLEGTYIGKWGVVGVDYDQRNIPNLDKENYTIRLSRNGHGAAIVIERTEGQFGYNVGVCYDEYTNVISLTPWPKDRLKGRANFMASMQGIIDAEYDKKN